MYAFHVFFLFVFFFCHITWPPSHPIQAMFMPCSKWTVCLLSDSDSSLLHTDNLALNCKKRKRLYEGFCQRSDQKSVKLAGILVCFFFLFYFYSPNWNLSDDVFDFYGLLAFSSFIPLTLSSFLIFLILLQVCIPLSLFVYFPGFSLSLSLSLSLSIYIYIYIYIYSLYFMFSVVVFYHYTSC